MPRFLSFLLAVLFVGSAYAQPERPRNVILFVNDGTGPASYTMARDFLRQQRGVHHLVSDTVQTGAVTTYSTSSRVTDSAAGATAFATGIKTYNGAIAVDTLEQPVATLLEAAEARGMATGLIATSRITHATPASFSAHVPSRAQEAEIAAQQIEQGIEVFLGGGSRFYLPVDAGGARDDGRNLLDEAAAAGYTVATDRAGFDAADAAPFLGLLTPSHMAYEIDRDPAAEPSLAEMTAKAIELLEDDEDGFFLMIEASRIDHAAHGNDAAAHLHDVLAFEEAFAVALEYARSSGGTLVVATSDHETGGLTLGRSIDGAGVYAWNPDVLAAVQSSHFPMIEAILREGRPAAEVFAEMAGVEDLTEEELVVLGAGMEDATALNAAIGAILSERAVVGWTTVGHTAVDVPLFSYGPGREHFRGVLDNTRIGTAIAELLGFDLEALTRALRDRADAAGR